MTDGELRDRPCAEVDCPNEQVFGSIWCGQHRDEAYAERTPVSDGELDNILQPLGDNGHHDNRGARVDCANCKRIEVAKAKLERLLKQNSPQGEVSPFQQSTSNKADDSSIPKQTCPRCKGTGVNNDDSKLGYPGTPCYYCEGEGTTEVLVNAQASKADDAGELRLGLQLVFFPSPIPNVLHDDAKLQLDKAMHLIHQQRQQWEKEARLDQVMLDFDAYNIELDVDESELIRIREWQLASLAAAEGKEETN